ncbi:unnamed protein product [Caenorhabditis auriculariae]|uniref:Fucosyltransferase n=1 Tax=Caenorhabditis auriculariae TaxID=2777116 RepID=A0A8S1HJ08_9PELO|nr:unnamed protein product [Caenorhabditis auriculariae]
MSRRKAVQEGESDVDLTIRVQDKGTNDPDASSRKSRIGAILKDGPARLKEGAAETIKRPLTGLFRRPGSRGRKREEEEEMGTAQPPSNFRGISKISSALEDVHLNEDSPRAAPNVLRAPIEGSGLEEVARAPQLTSTQLESMLQEDSVNDRTAHLHKFEKIDLSLLSRVLSLEEEVHEEDTAWTWDHLFTSLSQELREEWSHDNLLTGRIMRIRPASLYRNVLLGLFGFGVLYGIYSIVAYDDGSHVPLHKPQRHLYLTVSKDRISDRFDNLAPKRILYWTKVFGQEKHHSALSDCPGLNDRCIIDTNRDQISSADAVVFHAADISSQPLPAPEQRKSSQIYVFNSMETPNNSGRFAVPNNFFQLDVDVSVRFGRHSQVRIFLDSNKKTAESRGFKVQSYFMNPQKLKKTKSGIYGLVSNCDTASKREVALAELAKHMDVTIGGKCANKPGLRTICPPYQECLDIFEQYPFYIALENTVCEDYVTEKYWNRVGLPSIPIVMRRRVYEKYFPPKSFIAMDDYRNPKEMAEHLKVLQANETAYAEYFKWRNGEWTTAPWNSPGYRNGVCRVCELLWKRDENSTSKSIENVWTWFDETAKCEKDEFVQSWIKS